MATAAVEELRSSLLFLFPISHRRRPWHGKVLLYAFPIRMNLFASLGGGGGVCGGVKGLLPLDDI